MLTNVRRRRKKMEAARKRKEAAGRMSKEEDRNVDALLVDADRASPSKASELVRQSGGALEKLRRVSQTALQGVETEAALAPLHDVVQGQRATDDSLHNINDLFKEINKESKSAAPGPLADLEKVGCCLIFLATLILA